MIIIVHGPQVHAKSHYASALASHFGLDRVLKEWSAEKGIPPDGSLAVTNDKEAADLAGRHLGVVSLSFEDAVVLATRPSVLIAVDSALKPGPKYRRGHQIRRPFAREFEPCPGCENCGVPTPSSDDDFIRRPVD